MTFKFSMLGPYMSYFRDGLIMTLIFAMLTLIIGTILGMLFALMRMTRKTNPLHWISQVYITVLRGTPLMVQVFIIYFGLTALNLRLPQPEGLAFFGNLTKFVYGAIAMALNSGAYVAEIIRSGIQAVDKGQTEAARSLGLSNAQTMLKVIMPQATRNILPALGNEFIVVIKESSILSTIGVAELMYNADTVSSMTFRRMETLIIAAVLYLTLTMVLSFILGRVERRLRRGA